MNAAAMVERLWDLLLSQPNLLAAHLSHYAMLMRDETELAVTELRYRSLMLVMLLVLPLSKWKQVRYISSKPRL